MINERDILKGMNVDQEARWLIAHGCNLWSDNTEPIDISDLKRGVWRKAQQEYPNMSGPELYMEVNKRWAQMVQWGLYDAPKLLPEERYAD